MERPNLGKLLVFTERNDLLYAQVPLTPCSSYPMVTSAVTIPRQLAPTVGHSSKGVYIMGEALRGARELAIGRIIINPNGDRVIRDANWDLRSNRVKSGNLITIGKINVFVGMVRVSEFGSEEVSYESGS